MRKRRERLFGTLNEISEEKIDEAAPVEGKKQFHWKRWTALAASLVLIVGVGVGSYILFRPQLGDGSGIIAGSGGSGTNGTSTFMSYAGPVFPLTLKETDSAITAEREITLDFAPWVPVWLSNEEEVNSQVDLTPEQQKEALDGYNKLYPEGGRWLTSTDIQVTDAYTLTNTSQENKTISVLYPFVSSFTELDEHCPTLTTDGQELETTLCAGQYSNGYQGDTLFTESEPGSANLLDAHNWEDYKTMIEGTDYLKKVLTGWPDFSNVSVIVYEFTTPQAPKMDSTIRNSFNLDFSKTVVLSYGFNGTSQDREKGWMDKQFSILQGAQDQKPYYLIVVGEDIAPIDTQGGWDTTQTIEADVTVRRYETNLEDALRTVWQQHYGNGEGDSQDFELFFGLMKDQLLVSGSLAADPMERSGTGSLEEMDIHNSNRVFYLAAEVTIPAGGSVQLTAKMTKAGSYDFYCSNPENQGINGYDMVTKLGSNLICIQQTALLEDHGQIEIVRQNFGFDLENGVDRVILDAEQEHYYLEVKAK